MIHDAYRLARSIELKEKADSLLSERFEILRQLSADRIAEFPDTEPSIDLDTIDITLGDDASALLSIFICLPFLFPVPLPGLSTAFACAVIFLTIRPLLPRRPGLPSFIGKRQLKARTVEKMCHSGKSFLLRVEQLVHPRGIFLTKGIWRIISVCTVISSSVALALPFPPVIPFTNTLPALAIVFIALSELEDDGLAVIAGHFFHIATWVYFFIIGGTLFLSFEAIWEKLKTFLI